MRCRHNFDWHWNAQVVKNICSSNLALKSPRKCEANNAGATANINYIVKGMNVRGVGLSNYVCAVCSFEFHKLEFLRGNWRICIRGKKLNEDQLDSLGLFGRVLKNYGQCQRLQVMILQQCVILLKEIGRHINALGQLIRVKELWFG